MPRLTLARRTEIERAVILATHCGQVGRDAPPTWERIERLRQAADRAEASGRVGHAARIRREMGEAADAPWVEACRP